MAPNPRYAAQKKWREKQLAAGLCTKCCQPRVAESRYYCARHLEAKRAHSRKSVKKLQHRRREQGLCRRCGKPIDCGSLCPLHRAENMAHQRLHLAKTKGCRIQSAEEFERELLTPPPSQPNPDPVELDFESIDELARYEQVKALRAAGTPINTVGDRPSC